MLMQNKFSSNIFKRGFCQYMPGTFSAGSLSFLLLALESLVSAKY